MKVSKKKKFNESLRDFQNEVTDVLTGTARGKGYAKDGDGGRAFYDAVALVSDDNNDSHAKGEITYKVKRYGSKKDPKDLIKIAAWAFLLWDRHHRS